MDKTLVNGREQGQEQDQEQGEGSQRKDRETQDVSERAIVTLKLDSITLPDFYGDLTTWEAFRDMFEYLVDKSSKLSNIVKFQQLRSHLKGIAFDTIKGYRLSGENYKNAWDDVKKRFDRPDEIVNEYITRFLEVPAITHQANFENLSRIVDATNQMLRALPNLHIETDTWDPFLDLIIESKLDEQTRMAWKHKRGVHYVPHTPDLLTWLEARAIALQPASCDLFSRKLNKRH